MRHDEAYLKAGVNLSKLPVVGLGSIAGRGGSLAVANIVASLSAEGIRLHGFGVKRIGLQRFGAQLASADSTAWGTEARYQGAPGDRNSLDYALGWRGRILSLLEREGIPVENGHPAPPQKPKPAKRGKAVMSKVWHTEIPHRPSPFTIVIRSKSDPERSPRKKGADTLAWKKKVRTGSPDEWADRIVKLLSDGKPRTFNAIMVELADTTADVAFQEAPEAGLWRAMERGGLEMTYEAPIFFRSRKGRRSAGRPEPVPVKPKPIAGYPSLPAEYEADRSEWLAVGEELDLESPAEQKKSWEFDRHHGITKETSFDKYKASLHRARYWKMTPAIRKAYQQGTLLSELRLVMKGKQTVAEATAASKRKKAGAATPTP